MASLRCLAGVSLAFGVLGGCSLIYDADDLRRHGGVDARPPLPDADPQGLALTRVVDHGAFYEGTGTGGGRAALLDIEGANITSDAEVTVAFTDGGDPGAGGDDGMLRAIETVVSPWADRMVVAVELPVLRDLDDQATRQVTVTATQVGVSAQVTFDVAGLEQLAPAGPDVDAGTLKPLYSFVRFVDGVHFKGSEPALIRSTGLIILSAKVDVDGRNEVPGAHGCPGGAAATSGGCGRGGGHNGDEGLAGAGGGGGGFASTGDPATNAGTTFGQGGEETGGAMLAILRVDGMGEGNRGNGGGGGGNGTLGTGGKGGGGGGVLELTAGGAVRVDRGAASADGGNGALGTGVTAGGDGGGGSGGAILVRGAGGIQYTTPWLGAAKGTSAGNGGAGSLGRVRIDSADASIAAAASGVTPVRGPAWVKDTPRIVRTPSAELTLTGEAGRTYAVIVNDGAAANVSFSGATRAVTVALHDGVNQVCAVADPAVTPLRPENENCIQIGYVPTAP